MEPITRIEQLLSGVELTPITRLETYIASLNGQNVVVPSPVTRQEQILSGTELKPITRLEMFMMYGMGMLDSVPEPITREEWFWKNWSGGEPKEYEVYVSGILPLHLTNSVGADLVDWSITGDTAQDGKPSPENPIEVKSVGDYDASTGMYKLDVTCYNVDHTEEITTTQYLPTPLMANERLTPTAREVKWGKYVCTGDENLTLHQNFSDHVSVRLALPSPNKSERNGGSVMSTHLKALSFSNFYTNGEVGVCVHKDSENSTAYIAYTNMMSVNDYKSWLKSQYEAGTPVTVWYQLAEPTSEPVTTTPIRTLDGECWIDVDTEIRPPSMSATYKSSKPDNDMQLLMELFKEV